MSQKRKKISLIKINIVLLLLIFIQFSAYGEEKLNLLLKKLVTSRKLDKSIILNEIIEFYHNERNEKKILFYSKKALFHAQKYNQISYEILALSNIVYGYIGFNDYDKALTYAKQSINIATSKGNYKSKIIAYKSLAEVYDVTNNYNKSQEIYENIRKSAKEEGNVEDEAYSTFLKGIIYYRSGELNSSIEYFKNSSLLYKKINDKKNLIVALKFIGMVYSKFDNNLEAIKYYLDALKISQNEGYEIEEGRVYYSLGKLFSKMKNYKRAVNYLTKSLSLFKKHKIPEFIANVYLRIGNIQLIKLEYKEALDKYNQAIKIIKGFNDSDKGGLPELIYKKAKVEYELKDYYASSVDLKKAIMLSEKYSVFETKARCLILLSNIFEKNGNMNKSILNLKNALKIAEKINNSEIILEIYETLSKHYERKGLYKLAFYSQMQSKFYFKKIYDKNSTEKVTEIERKYQVEKKEKENEILKKDNEIQKLDIEKQKVVRNLVIVILGLTFIIVGFLIKKYSFLLAFWRKRSFIAHYKLGEKIGMGGSGIVYKATDIHDKTKEVAIKVIREESSSDENYKKRFKSEGSIIDRFDHPNIVKVIERGESGNTLFLVMEHLKGKSLDKIIEEESPLEYPRIYVILSEIVSAISSIHKKSIIHRDLKPENVIIVKNEDGSEQAKLLDFGIAKSKDITSLTKTGSLLGTIHYLAPEQIQMGEITFKSDIYSLGVICYELVTGVKPFYAEEEEYILSKIISDEAPAPIKLREDIPQDLNELILKMMEKDPKLRPEIGDIFKYFSRKLEGDNKSK